jgi:D-alanyl-D-alanine carboxypeptidase
VTTARDMAVLAVALIRDFPNYYKFFGQEEFRFGGRTHKNHNPMLGSYEGMDGLKTGYIYKAGYNLAASVKRDTQRVVAVVLGGDSSRERSQIMKTMLDLAFDRLNDPDHKRFTAPLTASLGVLPPVPSKRPLITRRAIRTMANATDDDVPVPRHKPPAFDALKFANLPHTRPSRGNPVLSGIPIPRTRAKSDDDTAMIPRPRKAKPNGAYGIQVGAYRSRGEASKQLTKIVNTLPGRLGEPDPIVAPFTDKRRRTYFRARLTGYDSRAAAHETCKWLQEQRTECIVIAAAP